MIAKIGDTIKWNFNGDEFVGDKFKDKQFEAVVCMIDMDERHYGVYAEYGQDLIDFDKCEIVTSL